MPIAEATGYHVSGNDNDNQTGFKIKAKNKTLKIGSGDDSRPRLKA